MLRLAREYRLNIPLNGNASVARGANRWAGEPVAYDPAAHVRIRLLVAGQADAATGYLADIRLLDERMARAIGGLTSETGSVLPFDSAARLLRGMWERMQDLPAPARRSELQLWLSPHLYWSIDEESRPMLSMTQSFEFSAAHRLHCPTLSDDENRAIFGKCNNPRGHGHNYIVDVTICGEPDARSGLLMPTGELESVVRREIIERYDHRHLNEDCPDFWSRNPTVESIAQVIFERLSPQIAPAKLALVRVWETPKTYAEYGGA